MDRHVGIAGPRQVTGRVIGRAGRWAGGDGRAWASEGLAGKRGNSWQRRRTSRDVCGKPSESCRDEWARTQLVRWSWA